METFQENQYRRIVSDEMYHLQKKTAREKVFLLHWISSNEKGVNLRYGKSNINYLLPKADRLFNHSIPWKLCIHFTAIPIKNPTKKYEATKNVNIFDISKTCWRGKSLGWPHMTDLLSGRRKQWGARPTFPSPTHQEMWEKNHGKRWKENFKDLRNRNQPVGHDFIFWGISIFFSL